MTEILETLTVCNAKEYIAKAMIECEILSDLTGNENYLMAKEYLDKALAYLFRPSK